MAQAEANCNVYTYYSKEYEYSTIKLDVQAMNKILMDAQKFCIKLTKDVVTTKDLEGNIKLYDSTIYTLSIDSVHRYNKRLFNDKLLKLNNFDEYTLICDETGQLSYLNVDIENKQLKLAKYPFFVKLGDLEITHGIFAEHECMVCLTEFEIEEHILEYTCCIKHIHKHCYEMLNKNNKENCVHCRCRMK